MSNLHRTRTQVYDPRVLEYFLNDKTKIDKGSLAHLMAIQEKTKRHNEFETQYNFKTDKRTLDCSIAKLGYGRIYGEIGSVEYLNNNHRYNLYADYYHDIDMKNCHPTILIQMAKNEGVNCDKLQEYVDNREDYLQKAIDYHDRVLNMKVDRAEMKRQAIATLYGSRGTIFDPIRFQLDDLTKALKSKWETLYQAVSKTKEKNINGAFLAYVAQTEERRCLEAIDSLFFSKGLEVDGLAYDGLMVRKLHPTEEFPQELLREAELYIKEKTGYIMNLEIKEMTKDISEEDLQTKEESVDSKYLTMKTDFEKTHFYFRATDSVCEINQTSGSRNEGRLEHFTLKHARTAFNGLILGKTKFGKNILFIDKWLEDPSRKTIHELVMKMPEECTDLQMSLFTGFDYKRIRDTVDEDKRQEYIDTFLNLVSANCADDTKVSEHLIKLFANMIQRPFTKSRVLTAFATKYQGCGKDTLMLIIKSIIGNAHTAHYTSSEMFWDKHDTMKEGAIFVYLEEACSKQNKAHESALKAFVTSPTININPKGFRPYSVENVANGFMTTNHEEPFNTDANDRRGNIISPSNRLTNSIDWSQFYKEYVNNPKFIKAIGEYLETIDLTDWISNNFPETKTKVMLKEINVTTEQRFLEYWVENIDTEEEEWVYGKRLFELYTNYCIENGFGENSRKRDTRTFCKSIIGFTDKLFKTDDSNKKIGIQYSKIKPSPNYT
jgi:hypothetical protein